MERLKIYEVKTEYIAYLSQYQDHIFWSGGEKAGRKYIGVIFQIGSYCYFAPLSSYKAKHKRMSETVDFLKIKDYAVININNMIPVPTGVYELTDINHVKDEHYRYLLQAESRTINAMRSRIMKNAEIVYHHKLRNGDNTPLSMRSNDFMVLEAACDRYISG